MSKNKNAPAEAGPLVEVRVLRDCTYGLWGEVAKIPAELVATAEADGMVDSHPDAVAYAKLLQAGTAEPAAEG